MNIFTPGHGINISSDLSPDLRVDQDVIHPPGCIAELRKRGYSNSTYMVDQQTDAGAWHKVGMYRLNSAKAVSP